MTDRAPTRAPTPLPSESAIETLAHALSVRADLASDWVHRTLPMAPDGKYDPEYQPPKEAEADERNHARLTKVLNDFIRVLPKDTPLNPLEVIDALVDQARHPDSIDDRKGAFSAIFEIMSHLPPQSAPAKKLAHGALTLLYNTIPHPPATSLGPQYTYRQADGGGNNIQNPEIGQAGTPYARSVQTRSAIAPNALPDPGLVFDTLMRARDDEHNKKFVEHPGGNSSLTFAWATIVTHSLFRTNPKDWNINDTSSYFDLSPLYGINQKTQDAVRDKAQGRGLLYPDVFSEERLTFLPPAASALLVVWNRNHNYIAENLLRINERGKWRDPASLDEAARLAQDEEIFQISRLVNCGHFMSFIVNDYVAAFLGVSEGITSPLLDDAFAPMKESSGVPVTRGQGNQCSVEFNVLYRWHSVLSEKDRAWTTNVFTHVFGDAKPLSSLTLPEFRAGFIRAVSTLSPDPRTREFGGIKRDPRTQRFADADIARILQDATDAPAGAFRARGVQPELRVIEILGIEQARKWGCCTMNEFREFLGLKRFASFEEWNPDKKIAEAARKLYGHVDNLELYVGLECEDIMPLRPGVRLSSGFTLMRAILADALALIRGDRYFTTDFTPWNLTAWGFQDCKRDVHNGALGGELAKLLARHLPAYYPPNSVYTCFPFFTPDHMKKSLVKRDKAGAYTFTRPIPLAPVHVVSSIPGIRSVLENPKQFTAATEKKYAKKVVTALFPGPAAVEEHRAWYRGVVAKQIAREGFEYDGAEGRYVDVVKHVANGAAVRWAAERAFGISLRTDEKERGVLTADEVSEMLATIFTNDFLAVGDAEQAFSNAWAAGEAHKKLFALAYAAVKFAAPDSGPNLIEEAAAHFSAWVHPHKAQSFVDFVERLVESEPEAQWDKLAAQTVGIAIELFAGFTHGAVKVIDFYLGDSAERKQNRAHMAELVRAETAAADKQLLGYVREALRLNPPVPGLWRDCVENSVLIASEDKLSTQVSAGDRVWLSLANAFVNPADFPNPTTVDIDRPPISLGGREALTTAQHVTELTILEVVKAVFELPNVRRAAGDAGQLTGFTQVVNGTPTSMYLSPYGTVSRWPGSMNVVYDA
ncbi:Heme peroxidase [Mycena kentingensis (nom. inval.)]|nr:Heme peroxidase [Mycena kentingensis (nom. inval.)]